MSENSTGSADDANTNDSVFEGAMDDAIDSLLDKAVESGALQPAYDEQDEASTPSEDEDTEELEGEEEDQADEDAENVDEDEDDATEDEEESKDDEESTLDDETEEEEEGELDMDFMVPVKVDGEESEVTLEELVKGYQTNQSQTKKGQELAEQAKELKSAKDKADLFSQINVELLKQQDDRDKSLLKSRKDIMDLVAKGEYVEGVDDDLATLQYKYKSLEDEYITRKADRDSTVSKMEEANKERYEEVVKERVENFQKEIKNIIPDWSTEIAQENYKFAIDQGIPEGFVASITDPEIAKFIDDYRRLKSSSSKGAVKRKKVPVKKVPNKKPVSDKVKQKSKTSKARSRVQKGKGSDSDFATINDGIYDDIFDGSELF
jgi:hypothetical protein